MRAFRAGIFAGVAACLLVCASARAADGGTPARGWVKRLVEAGRGEVPFVRENRDPLTGEDVTERGLLALEPPGRASVAFPRTGERLTVRPDGGEWLQPGLGQMIQFGPGDAGLARAWWEILFAAADSVRADAAPGGDRLILGPDRGGARDSAWVRLDRAGLPERLTVRDAGERVVYRLGRWKFTRARGPSAFHQDAPEGIEIVDLR